MSFGNNSGLMRDYAPQAVTARESWLQCIHDIQDHTVRSLSDVFSREELHNSSSPPLLFIDPSYHGNAGDNFIAYGSLVFLEKMGFRNHTECNIAASIGFSPNCGNFSHFEEQGLAVWQGGGYWGDLWEREQLLLTRLTSTATLAKKGKIVVGFPQSIHYNNKDLQTRDAKMFMEKFSDFQDDLKKNVILTWRQEKSYALAKELYPLVENRYHCNTNLIKSVPGVVYIYINTRITTSAKQMPCSSRVTLFPGWRLEGFKCFNQSPCTG